MTPGEPLISTITLAELSSGTLVATADRALRQAVLQQAEPVPSHTCNPDDFRGMDGLVVHEVPHPDHERRL
ncbi:PIN domain-containing protein [Microlunatus antarcticus]|uniref:Uncharacterized protein n=1 Tax=Microlunatus antarcticus TaxID=53388 RepID=A0A7W5JVQ3_9ACTN|nr:hypothetical protein [Microlunatus antarcticus]MBB3327123.1 hypothetical protein [Microlunatus antarcticus]